jgi:hypothetical protein
MKTPSFASTFLAAALAATAGCSSSARLGVDDVYYASERGRVVQTLNAKDTSVLRDQYEAWLARDIKTLHHRLGATTLIPYAQKERAVALRTLQYLAVMNERFPVSAWNNDQEVVAALKWAIDQDNEAVSRLRSRDWSRPGHEQ